MANAVADGDKLVVGTRPLSQRDLLLAVLARDDVMFSAFPADGAVLVAVGNDGWALVATGARPSVLEIRTAGDKPVSQSPIV